MFHLLNNKKEDYSQKMAQQRIVPARLLTGQTLELGISSSTYELVSLRRDLRTGPKIELASSKVELVSSKVELADWSVQKLNWAVQKLNWPVQKLNWPTG